MHSHLINFILLSLAVVLTALPSRSGPSFNVKKGQLDKPPVNHCIIVCAHTYCRPLCSNPTNKHGSTDDKVEMDDGSTAAALVDTTNAQAGLLGVQLTPGMKTVVLGQKGDGAEKCAWLCGDDGSGCNEACWAADKEQDAVVVDGGALTLQDGREGLSECQIMDKDGVGRLIVCAVPGIDGGGLEGSEVGWNGLRCALFWGEGKPQLECGGV